MTKKEILQRRRTYTRQFFKGNKGNLALSFAGSLSIVFMNLGASWLLQVLIDMLTEGQTKFTLSEALLSFGLIMGVFLFGSFLMYHGQSKFVATAIARYKIFVFEKLSQKGVSAFCGENTSLYLSALNNDANAIEADYLCNICALITQFLLFAGALTMMMIYSPLLTIIGIALALLPVLASLLSGNRVAKAEANLSKKNESYLSTLSDALSGFAVVKAFKAEKAICRLFAKQVKETTDAKIKRRQTIILVQVLALSAGLIAQVGVFVAGLLLAKNGHPISAGTIIAFVNLMNNVSEPVGVIPQYLAQKKAAAALVDKLAAALEENVREEGSEEKKVLTTAITLQNLSYSYDGEKKVLDGIDFTFTAGKSYAVVGASGSGKSTLLQLLMASFSDYTGEILYDDTELRQIDSKSLYSMLSMVQQNVFLFNASIRDNITMFSDFPKEAVDRAMALSGLSALVAERGEDALCGENGSGLSGGEKQRISIARSLLKESCILLADEATAALDPQTAFQVTNAILELDSLTRIVVTHALDENLLQKYDCILTLKNGRLAEAGSFLELMEKKGCFYSLFTVSQ